MIIFTLLLWCVIALPLALWTDRSLEFWLTLLAKHPVEVPYWLSLVVTIILNGIILAVNVVSELVRLVM